ncbi:MAG: hypothetical protein KC416_15290, partial [Myxococcales bacterium]|nr:hypothetical protein [Myxococcales bacterium]
MMSIQNNLAAFVLLAILGIHIAGCGDDKKKSTADEVVSAMPGVRPSSANFEGTQVHRDLLSTLHLADVDQGGLYIDFGTPARAKYTIGDWRTGWINDTTSGNQTYSLVEETGRVFFNVDKAGPITIRFRVRAVGSQKMSVYLNNKDVDLVTLENSTDFKDYDLTIPAELVKVGENYLLLRFGGSVKVGGHDVAAAVESIRVVSGTSIPKGIVSVPFAN